MFMAQRQASPWCEVVTLGSGGLHWLSSEKVYHVLTWS